MRSDIYDNTNDAELIGPFPPYLYYHYSRLLEFSSDDGTDDSLAWIDVDAPKLHCPARKEHIWCRT